ERHAHAHYGFVGSRSAFTCTFRFCVLSTTLISNGYLPGLSFHWTPTTGVATTPGAGPLVKSSGPDIPSYFTLGSALATSGWSCGSLTLVNAWWAISNRL